MIDGPSRARVQVATCDMKRRQTSVSTTFARLDGSRSGGAELTSDHRMDRSGTVVAVRLEDARVAGLGAIDAVIISAHDLSMRKPSQRTRWSDASDWKF